MIIRRSRFIHQIPVGEKRILIVHAINHTRLPADDEVNTLLNWFGEPRALPQDIKALQTLIAYDQEAIEKAIKGLLERQILTEKTPEEELSSLSQDLSPLHGRDPGEI